MRGVGMGCSERVDVEALLARCTAAGVVFRPRAGKLRPRLTRGQPPEGLLEEVAARRRQLYAELMALFSLCGEIDV